MNIGKHLRQSLAGHGSAPNNRLVGLSEEADAEDFHAIVLDRDDLVLSEPHRLQGSRFLVEHIKHESALLGP